MKSKLFIFGATIVAFIFSTFHIKAQVLSPNAKISLLTVSPGEELYSSFGHSALWVSDYERGIDRVYNYGTFDFRTDNFYVKFVRGTLPYTLSVSPSYYTLEGSRQDNRSVYEQVLNLSLAQKERLYNFLETNYLPENRQYLYKFFYDNCSTRLRDALVAACGDSLKFIDQPIDGTSEAKSFRQWMNTHLDNHKWVGLAMNIAIGLPSDKTCTPKQEMYLPINLQKHLDRAKLGSQKLVKAEKNLVPKIESTAKPSQWNFIYTPSFFSMLLFFAYYITKRYRKKPAPIWFDKVWLGILGLVGLILLPLWLLTDHGVTNWNQSLLIFVPTHLFVLFFINKKAHYHWLWKYFTFCLGLLLLWVGIFIFGIVWNGSNINLMMPLSLIWPSYILIDRYRTLMTKYKTTT